jgi:NAD(P)-dependent dehydrogenase (short-subunit alcohol dehydrogenase family)
VERTVLVTGSSSGIGRATALHLAGLGFRVVASARTADGCQVVEDAAARAGVTVETAVVDVRDPATYAELVPRLEPWALVNNAGCLVAGTVEDVAIDDARGVFETLLFGPFRLVQLALPAMRRRGDGRIVNVSSATAHGTSPLLGWYGAAKHALSAMNESLRAEVAAAGIQVVAVEPGAIATALWDDAEADLSRRAPTSRTPAAYERALSLVRSARPRMPGPETVAATIAQALQAGRARHTYRVGWDAWAVPAARLLPAAVRDKVVRSALQL